MSDAEIINIAHIGSLKFIGAAKPQIGPAVAKKGLLMRNAIVVCERMEAVNYETTDDFVASIEGVENPTTKVGKKTLGGKPISIKRAVNRKQATAALPTNGIKELASVPMRHTKFLLPMCVVVSSGKRIAS